MLSKQFCIFFCQLLMTMRYCYLSIPKYINIYQQGGEFYIVDEDQEFIVFGDIKYESYTHGTFEISMIIYGLYGIWRGERNCDKCNSFIKSIIIGILMVFVMGINTNKYYIDTAIMKDNFFLLTCDHITEIFPTSQTYYGLKNAKNNMTFLILMIEFIYLFIMYFLRGYIQNFDVKKIDCKNTCAECCICGFNDEHELFEISRSGKPIHHSCMDASYAY